MALAGTGGLNGIHMTRINFNVTIESLDENPDWEPNADDVQVALQDRLRGWRAEVRLNDRLEGSKP